jgi:hypothetical protein
MDSHIKQAINNSLTTMAIAQSPDVPLEDKMNAIDAYAKAVGMDETNQKGFEVLAKDGPKAAFKHMVDSAGGDYATMMAMYH